MISIKSDLDKLSASLTDMQRNQLPFATSKAINDTAKAIRAASAAGAKKMTARPFTTSESALFITPSNKNNLSAVVGYKDVQARYLQWQIGGGKRVTKGFEIKLRAMGVLPAGYVTVPGAGVKLDQYGNIPLATLSTIFGLLASRSRIYAGRGKRLHGEALFVIVPGSSDHRATHLQPGIYQRIEHGSSSNIKPLIMFIHSADYKAGKFFDFQGIARKTAEREFPGNFSTAIAYATSTAR